MAAVRRFAIAAPNFYPRVCGVGDYSARMGAELRRRGHEVALFSRRPAEPNPDVPGMDDVRGVGGQWATGIARHVAEGLAAYRPTDLLIQYTPQMWDATRFGSPAATWLAAGTRRAGARVTLIAHELVVPWLPRPDLALAAASQRVQLAALLKACDRTFVTTGTRARTFAPLCRLLGVPAPGVVRVGPGALPIERDHRRNGAATIAPRIGFFSTAALGKRYDVVLGAFARIGAEIPLAELVLIGDLGPPDHPRVRAIMDDVSRHPAKERIRLTGKRTLAQIAAEMSTLDLYLFPMETGANTRSSTLPVALGAHLPTVAVSGRETDQALFRDGENIVFAREMSAAAFAEASLKLLRDSVLLERVAAGGGTLYQTHMTWERIVDHLLAEIDR
jgi:glycosyltransferase involved in cell wall biosynthesis